MSEICLIQRSKQQFMQVDITSYSEKSQGVFIRTGHFLGLIQYTFNVNESGGYILLMCLCTSIVFLTVVHFIIFHDYTRSC